MQWKYKTSNNQLSGTLDLLKGHVGDLIRSGAKLPEKINSNDKEFEKEVFCLLMYTNLFCSTC